MTLCNCDCILLTTAFCRGLHWYTMRCGIRRNDSWTISHGQKSKTRLSSERFSVCNGIPRNPDGLDFLQPAQCAYADDLAVAASSFRGLMTALAPAFHSVDHTAGIDICVVVVVAYCSCASVWSAAHVPATGSSVGALGQSKKYKNIELRKDPLATSSASRHPPPPDSDTEGSTQSHLE